ncbi:uncharacterized protein BROUX77_001367 [Berkeleyomyces rouxiae]|uniref:uncharacterized protein n=1 Tax=Berkeleyomyces rouxiae TaxID=2035830 RepID=UPI003B7B52A8
MCDNVYAEFRCAIFHKACGEEGIRLKHIVRCNLAQANGLVCALREGVHILQEDEPLQDCSECRGETPPESPQL